VSRLRAVSFRYCSTESGSFVCTAQRRGMESPSTGPLRLPNRVASQAFTVGDYLKTQFPEPQAPPFDII
jgi:hypothetical protein